MKSYRVMLDGYSKIVVEFSFRDLLKLLFGREMRLTEGIVMRNRWSYLFFNTKAPIDERRTDKNFFLGKK